MCLLCTVFVLVGFVCWQLLAFRQAVRAGDLARAERAAAHLATAGTFISPAFLGDRAVLAPLRIMPQILHSSMQLALQLPELSRQQTEGAVNLATLQPQLEILQSQLQSLEQNLAAHPTTQRLVTQNYPAAVTLLPQLQHGLSAVHQLISTNGAVLILLQNTEELRATGGFMGSYIFVTLQEGVLRKWVVEDIYDADGQFTGFVAAPPGLKEYLSSAQGMRLPDANWSPDFPTSAEHILQFFALSNRSDIQAVAAINLTLAQQLLEVIGPVQLPDYATTITAENIASTLREERGEFFAGSARKKHVLEQLVVQMQLKLSQLSSNQVMSVAKLLSQAVANKSVQMYGVSPTLQSTLRQAGISGEIAVQPHTNPVLLVESNVGINKANRGVHREIAITHQGKKLEITITFRNTNAPLTSLPSSTSQQALHNGYINYQRLFVLPGWRLQTVSIDATPAAVESERIITTASGIELTEYGLLLRVPEQATRSVQFQLTTEDVGLASLPVVLLPQSGVTAKQVRSNIQN